MKQKFGVKIMPREVILDTQGRAVEQTLRLNHLSADSVRVGRYVEVEVPASLSESEAKGKVEKMVKLVLYNPLIETFEIQKI